MSVERELQVALAELRVARSQVMLTHGDLAKARARIRVLTRQRDDWKRRAIERSRPAWQRRLA